jgi:hypothetical protein
MQFIQKLHDGLVLPVQVSDTHRVSALPIERKQCVPPLWLCLEILYRLNDRKIKQAAKVSSSISKKNVDDSRFQTTTCKSGFGDPANHNFQGLPACNDRELYIQANRTLCQPACAVLAKQEPTCRPLCATE